MSISTDQYVPEFAIIVGVFFGLATVVSGIILRWGLTATICVCAVSSYPFIAFGVVRDTNPTATIRPRWVLSIGTVIGMLGAVGTFHAMLGGQDSVTATVSSLFIGFILVSPPAGYAVHHGVNINPFTPQVTAGGCLIIGVGCVFAGLFSLPLIGVLLGTGVGISGALYATARGLTLTQQTKQRVAIISGVIGLTIAFIGIAGGEYIGSNGTVNGGEWLFVGATLALAPSLYIALTGGQTTQQTWSWPFKRQ
ncbi:hypothetical protein [Haloquadratum walsbyi]|mgnify:FL=1|uniref:hypothetical protein n=1 Tax=Haloquadratum walsbyi TaxID=293091 RepID=UPI0023F4C7F0|nr:hypothetical protein [Haloquadratum walsbyi]